MAQLEIPDALISKLLVTMGDPATLTFQHGAHAHCMHWTLENAGEPIACACDTSTSASLIELLAQIATTASTQESEPDPAPSPEEDIDHNKASRPAPPADGKLTPAHLSATIGSQLTYQPPAFLEPHEHSHAAQHHILPKALKSARHFGLTLSDLHSIIIDPEEVNPGYNSTTIYESGEYAVIVGADTMIVAVIPRKRVEHQNMSRQSLPGQKTKAKLPAPTNKREMKEAMRSHGFVESYSGGGHIRFTHPDFPGLSATMPNTGSDYRGFLNFVQTIKEQFGIDLRDPA